MEELIEQCNAEFQEGEIYSSAIIAAFLSTCENARYENPAAYTYNRWNRGMAEIFPLFEWLQRGEYRYLGWGYAYTGQIYHYPQGELARVIGEYIEGQYNFYNPDILNFADWRQGNDNGIPVAVLGSKVTFSSADPMITQRRKLTDNADLSGQLVDGFAYIHFESNLGQRLINKMVGDTFNFGNIEYQVEEID